MEDLIKKLEDLGAKQKTENVWFLHGHYFQIYKKEDGNYDIREL